jgi:hypothetical protein
LPESSCERIVAAAIRLLDGSIFSHATHYDAIWVAFDAGVFPNFTDTSEEGRAAFADAVQSGKFFEGQSVEDGFTTDKCRFVGREEAFHIARSARQVRAKKFYNSTPALDVEDFPLAAI